MIIAALWGRRESFLLLFSAPSQDGNREGGHMWRRTKVIISSAPRVGAFLYSGRLWETTRGLTFP